MEENKRNPSTAELKADSSAPDAELESLYRGLQPDIPRAKPSPDALAAALEAVQRMAAEMGAEHAAGDTAQEAVDSTGLCRACGYRNRDGNKFCGMCGAAVAVKDHPGFHSNRERARDNSIPDWAPEPGSVKAPTVETHHYHHHYHHHYFQGGAEAAAFRPAAEPTRADTARDFRPNIALRADMSRAEAAVRSMAQEWVLACNTKHLDDLLELYIPDSLVLRSNCPPIRGASAVREFFFGGLEAGLGEVELEPLRVEVAGDFAYEAGRFKALTPSSTGKRREERGKYLWVCARQSNGEWRLSADCWSSDLTLSAMDSEVPQGPAVKTNQPRKQQRQ